MLKSLSLATLALLAASAAKTSDEDAAPQLDDPATRDLVAPIDVNLVITEDDRLLGAGLDYAEVLFPRLSEEHPGRFTYNEDDEVWTDSDGEYEYDDENEVYWQNISAAELTRGRQDFGPADRLQVVVRVDRLGVEDTDDVASMLITRSPYRKWSGSLDVTMCTMLCKAQWVSRSDSSHSIFCAHERFPWLSKASSSSCKTTSLETTSLARVSLLTLDTSIRRQRERWS